MPTLGADMEQGTIIEWLVHPGDHVRRGDLIAVVDTDKADIEIESFVDGVIEALLLDVGVTVPVGTPIATVGTEPAPAAITPVITPPAIAPPANTPPANTPPAITPSAITPPAITPSAITPPAITPSAEPSDDGAQHTVSPLLRRLARHLGVDLHTLTGSGPGGRVVRADVEAAATMPPTGALLPPPTPAPPPADIAPSRDRDVSMRRAIASLMTRSAREVPQYHVALRVDLSPALQWLEDTNLDRPLPERIVPAALLVKAVARAAAQIPELHGFWVDGGFQPAERIAVGLAVSLRGGGLLVPTLYDADRLELGEIMSAMRDLVERARAGRLRATELTGAGITVTNLGDTGVDVVHGLLVPPQVALVGFGRIHDEAWAEHGMVGARPVVHVSLAGDHRASDGIEGARFLNRIAQLLHEPDRL